MSLFRNDIIIFIENSMEYFLKLLELITEFRKFSRYEINTQKSIIFLHTSFISFLELPITKYHKLGWFKTAEMYSLTVLEARDLISRY